MRTAFNMLALNGVTHAWSDSVFFAQVLVTTLVLLLSFTGSWRYYKIKKIIALKVPPNSFGRITLKPLNLLVVITAITSAVAMYASGWDKGDK